MKKIVGIVALIVVLSGCSPATIPFGRFLQLKSPVNDRVTAQFNYPNERSCRFFLDYMSDEKTRDLMKCNNVSASPSLPYHAIVRDLVLSYTLEIETSTEGVCSAMVDGMVKDKAKGEIVTPCQEKTK